MNGSYLIRATDTDGLELDLIITAAEFEAVCRVSDVPGQFVEIAGYRGFVFNALGQAALCLKPPSCQRWRFFYYEQFKQGASPVI